MIIILDSDVGIQDSRSICRGGDSLRNSSSLLLKGLRFGICICVSVSVPLFGCCLDEGAGECQ